MIQTTVVTDGDVFRRQSADSQASISVRGSSLGVLVNFTEGRADIYLTSGKRIGRTVKLGTFYEQDVIDLQDEREV